MTLPVAPETITEHVTGVAHGFSNWALCGWYMLGAACRGGYRLLGWYRDHHGHTFKYEVAEVLQEMILAFAMAFVWTQALIWAWADFFQLEIPTFGITQLSSVAVGFFLTWLVGEKIMAWFAKRKEK